MELIIPIALGAYSLISIALFFYVLIKLFKAEGALKGILGFFCGIYTFIWGWVKHKEQKLTAVMALWTFLAFAPVILSVVMPGILATMNLGNLAKTITGPSSTSKQKGPIPKKAKVAKRVKKKKASQDVPKPTDEAGRQKSVELVDKARELWKGDNLSDPNLALNLLNQAVSADPNSAVAFNDRGRVHAKMGQYDRALKDYDVAIKLDSNYVRAYSNRGSVLYETNQYDDALKDFNRAIVLSPSYATAYLNRGLVNYQMDRIDNACKDFAKACELGECDGADWAKKSGTCK